MSFERYKPSRAEVVTAETTMSEEQKRQSESREREIAAERFETALHYVCEKYPELAEKIKTSLETPQLGKYHNEGPRMESHLSLILSTLEAVKNGEFHESLDNAPIREVIRGVVTIQEEGGAVRINPELIDYTFLHDLSKQDCLSLKIEGEKKGIEITWDEWKDIERAGEPYSFRDSPIVSISYFHGSKGESGQHGNTGAELLGSQAISPDVLIAIRKHEVAYQFSKINAAVYKKHFIDPGFTEDQQHFICAAAYIDTMSSLQPDGMPDLKNFMNLVHSRENYRNIQKYLDKGVMIRENDLGRLMKSDTLLTNSDIEKYIREKS